MLLNIINLDIGSIVFDGLLYSLNGFIVDIRYFPFSPIILCVKEAVYIVFDGKVNDLSPDDHDKDKLFEDVHEAEFLPAVVSGQPRNCHILPLLDERVFVADVPAQGLAQWQQEAGVVLDLDEACRVVVVVGPLVSEEVAQLIVHKLVILLWDFLKRLQDYRNKKLHENHRYQYYVAVEK